LACGVTARAALPAFNENFTLHSLEIDTRQERSLAAFLDGQDLRREPFETRKVTLASLLRGIRAGGEA
jgi:hypothetical protein